MRALPLVFLLAGAGALPTAAPPAATDTHRTAGAAGPAYVADNGGFVLPTGICSSLVGSTERRFLRRGEDGTRRERRCTGVISWRRTGASVRR